MLTNREKEMVTAAYNLGVHDGENKVRDRQAVAQKQEQHLVRIKSKAQA